MWPLDVQGTEKYYGAVEENTFNIPDMCCLNCHFLVEYKYARPPWSFGPPVSKEYRRDILNNPTSQQNKLEMGFEACACGMGVWSPPTTIEEARDDLGNSNWERVIRERGDTCFFWPYDNRLSVDAAKELERRHRDRKMVKWNIIGGCRNVLPATRAGWKRQVWCQGQLLPSRAGG